MRLSCTVCYELFIPSDNVHVAPCGHMLHLDCWQEWLGRSKNCPDCRKPTQVYQLIKLFFNIGEGDDYSTLSNKYDALRCDLSCKTKDCETAEKKLKIQTQEAASLRQSVQKLKTEIEQLKKNSGNVSVDGSSATVKLGMAMYKNLLKSKEESDSAVQHNKALAEEIAKLKKKAQELEKSKKSRAPVDNSLKYSDTEIRMMKNHENIVKNLKKCVNDYEELKKNSAFLKSLRAYTNQVDSYVDMWDDVDTDPEKYVDLFKDVKKYFEQKLKREEELNQSPRGCVLELSGIPKRSNLDWHDFRDAVEALGGSAVFTTFNPGDEVAYVRLENCYPGEAPAFQFMRNMNGKRIRTRGIILTPRALGYQEENAFLKKSLEDRDRRNRERFRRRRGFNDDPAEENTLLDCSMRMVSDSTISDDLLCVPAY